MLSTASYPAASYRIQNSYNLIPPPVYFGFHRPVILVTIFWGHLSLPIFLVSYLMTTNAFLVITSFLGGNKFPSRAQIIFGAPLSGVSTIFWVFLVGNSFPCRIIFGVEIPIIFGVTSYQPYFTD